MNPHPIRCVCGQKIQASQLLEIRYLQHSMGQNRVYVRFECPRCGHARERLIRQQEWDRFVLSSMPYTEISRTEREQFQLLGEITKEEHGQARRMLEDVWSVEQLQACVQPDKNR